MLMAAWWGFVAGAALLVGAALATLLKIPIKVVGLTMAFGSGVLISALAFELTSEAFDRGGGTAVLAGLAAGSLVFWIGDWWVDQRGGHRRKNPTGTGGGSSSNGAGAGALVLGSLLDGIPESAAIGVSLIGGGSVGVAVVAAVFLSNVPEGLSASAGMKAAGHSHRYIFGVWALVTAMSALAAALGFGLLAGASPLVIAIIQAFAAGAILTMLADTMLPESVEHAGSLVGMVTVVGFAAAFLLSMA
ncbi:ZIP family metal transporter [Nocardioides mesophilus]|uniref:ZIP family zinc transporter n=1 Tax=Nocardioides mesophilus TaxID=433659 RepID=A0A7G9R8H1_9ACTN|nr:ZIP family zinc transporter [Nocardioides mesophilus]QNN51896.1 ZIP family zinc transporter [Nocardioides mesophilus]